MTLTSTQELTSQIDRVCIPMHGGNQRDSGTAREPFNGDHYNRRAHRVDESLRFVRAAHDYDRHSATIKDCVHSGPE